MCLVYLIWDIDLGPGEITDSSKITHILNPEQEIQPPQNSEGFIYHIGNNRYVIGYVFCLIYGKFPTTQYIT